MLAKKAAIALLLISQQALNEATRIDEMRSRALTDLAKLRELEAEHAAVGERLEFQKSKANWVQERIHKGYEGDVEKLWENGAKAKRRSRPRAATCC
ncbi:MAG: hypothetical protein RKP20_04775 [Candidatus Competibacter sp.]|nr:hypothetical protein [Candidatus Competibacter sp.]